MRRLQMIDSTTTSLFSNLIFMGGGRYLKETVPGIVDIDNGLIPAGSSLVFTPIPFLLIVLPALMRFLYGETGNVTIYD